MLPAVQVERVLRDVQSATAQAHQAMARQRSDTETVVLEGQSAAAAQTSLPLSIGGGAALQVGEPGIPVMLPMFVFGLQPSLAVSWLSDSVPSGPWTATLWRRPAGGASFSPIAAAEVPTS